MRAVLTRSSTYTPSQTELVLNSVALLARCLIAVSLLLALICVGDTLNVMGVLALADRYIRGHNLYY